MARRHTRRLARQFLDVVPQMLHALRALARPDASGATATLAQLRCLHVLAHRPQSLRDLARHHGVSAPAMSRMVSGFVERGWVARDEAPGDRRQLVLSLRPPGRAVLAALHAGALDQLSGLLAELSPAEQQALAVGLDGLARVLAERGPAERSPAERGPAERAPAQRGQGLPR